MDRAWGRVRGGAVAAVAVLLAGVVGSAPATSSAAITSAAITVDVSDHLGPINRDLVGIHGRASAASIGSDYGELRPTTHRHVMSAYDFMSFDCTTKTIAASSLDYFNDWLDAVAAQGAEAILSLSYVPPCYAKDGQPKGPVVDVAGYRAYLDQLFASLVTQRAADGKVPLRRFELWNEPDIPIDPGNPSAGHGYVGTLDEYVATNLPSLVGALLQAQADSGVHVQVGTPASFAPWSFSFYAPDLASLLHVTNGFSTKDAAAIAAQADAAFGPGATDRIMHNGGFTWPRRVIDEAEKLGLDIDFVSVHLYPNNPLQGVTFPEPDHPELLKGRNPLASPEDFARLSARWSAEFPDQELIVSEWGLSAGNEQRNGTCETAAFDAASLSVMQEGTVDRALFLGRPGGVEDAPFRAWGDLPAEQVAADVPSSLDGVWATAASDASRTTLLVSQWHSLLDDAKDLSVPIVVKGLADGDYTVTVDWIGEGRALTPGTKEVDVTSTGGELTLPVPVPLRGQSLARIDIRPTGTAALRPFTRAESTAPAGTCLPDPRSNPTTTTTTTAVTSTTTPGTESVPPAAQPVDGAPTYTG